MVHKIKYLTFMFLGFVGILLFSHPVLAVQFKQADNLVFTQNEKINETVFAGGKQITVDSNINGDLFCGGQNVVVNGHIAGDIICAAQTIRINGVVDGNVRVAAQIVDISGTVTRNLNVLAQTVSLADKSSVKGDIIFGAQTIDLSGSAGRDLSGVGQSVTISGSLLRNALVNVDDLNITNTAAIRGNLDYITGTEGMATISSNAVKGTVMKHELPVKQPSPMKTAEIKPVSYSAVLMASLIGAIAFFIVACSLIFFDKDRTERITNAIQSKPFISFIVGLATLFSFPFAFFLLLITFIGMPLAFIGLLIYIAALISASTYTSIVIGWNLVKLFKKNKPGSIVSALVGTVVLGILITIPVIGWIFGVVALLTGLGSFILSYLPEKA